SLFVLALSALVLGACAAAFALARHALVAIVVSPVYRGRALAMLGGSFRAGFLVGPVFSAGLALTLDIHWVLLIAGGGVGLLVCALVAVVPDSAASPVQENEFGEPDGFLRTVRRYRRVYLTAGVGTALVAALRASRMVLVPLA